MLMKRLANLLQDKQLALFDGEANGATPPQADALANPRAQRETRLASSA